jgi:hypothetical protein
MTGKREVSYDGSTYKVRSDKILIPDFTQMDRIAVLMWLNRYTYVRGIGTRTRSNLLQGFDGTIGLSIQ